MTMLINIDNVDDCDDDDEIDRVDEGKHLETISGAVSHKGLSHTHMVAMHIQCTYYVHCISI